MRLFDTHAHLADERFDEDRAEVIAESEEMGVVHILECATGREDFEKVLGIAAEFPCVYAAVGIHPHCADASAPDDLELLESLLEREKVVAVGEIGLDYHYVPFSRERQTALLEAQLHMAVSRGLPVSLHCREATGDMLAVLKNFPGLRGVMHCFSGSPETAEILVDMGLHIGFGGTTTFKNARRSPEVLRVTPAERILIETDCPYLAPEPLRGRRNIPGYTYYVAQVLAEVTGIADIDDIACENGRRLFGIEAAAE